MSSKCKVVFIVSMFVVVSLLLQAMISLQSDISNGVRAYVRGEGLWAKAQKDAIYNLQRYATSGNQAYYQAYLKVIKIPLGDKKARLALQTQPVDRGRAREGFLQGQNHPDDIADLIDFFLYFQHVSYMRDAIQIWTEADQLIGELQRLGTSLRHTHEAGEHKKSLALLDQLHRLNNRLGKLENAFSLTLEKGARWIKHTLSFVSLSLLTAMLIVTLLASARIIKGIAKTEKDLWLSERRFRSLMQSNLLGMVAWHGDGRILDANDAFLDMLGLDHRDVRSGQLNWNQLTPDNHRDRDHQALTEIAEKGSCQPYEKAFYHSSGTKVPVYLGATLLDGEREEGICFVMDLTERKHSEAQLRLAATVFEASNEGILVTDRRLRIIAVNEAFCNITGYRNDDLLGHTPRALRSGLMSREFYNDMWRSLKHTGHWQGDILDRKSDGSVLPARLSISAVLDTNKNASHYVAIFTDISERKAAEEQLQQLAHHDYLTGLANRHLLTDRLEQAIQRIKRHGHILAVLFFDLDSFKPVNDQYGHETGDKLLQEIARRLQSTVRGSDTIARMGGDEFVVLLEDLQNTSVAADIASKIITAINEPCVIDNQTIQVGSSVGISFYPEDCTQSHGLIKCADNAMYEAKASGSNRYCFYQQIAVEGMRNQN